MKRNSMMFTALGLGAAYLLRSKDSRQKLMNQIQSFSRSKNQSDQSVSKL